MIVYPAFAFTPLNGNEPTTWTQRTDQNTENWGIYSDGTTWLVGGNGGEIQTATNPTSTWTSRTSNLNAIQNVFTTMKGTSYWVCGGGGSGNIFSTATSATGTWTGYSSIASEVPGNLYDGASSGSLYVFVGAITISFHARIYTATDPTGTWTAQSSGITSGTGITSIAYDGSSTWVGCSSGEITVSTSPTSSWTKYDVTGSWESVVYGDSVWVLVGSSGAMKTATDPTGTWTTRTSSFGTSTIYDIAYYNGVWVAVGASGKLATATDPTGTWTQRTSSFGTSTISGVYGDGNYWVAGSADGKIATGV